MLGIKREGKKVFEAKTPEQLKFKFALWTREAVEVLMKHQLDISIPISNIHCRTLFKEMAIHFKKTIKRAYERKDEYTKKFLEEEYPV